MIIMLLLVDLYLHSKYSIKEFYNYCGYRGNPVASKKKPGEVRIGVFGGSVGGGYGVSNDFSIAGYLQNLLNIRNTQTYSSKQATVVNLCVLSEHKANYFMANYNATKNINLDICIIYFYGQGGPDEFIQEKSCIRFSDMPLKRFNYSFILPTLLQEKYYLMRYGSVEKGYKEDKLFGNAKLNFSFLDSVNKVKPKNKIQESSLYGKPLAAYIEQLTRQGKFFILAIAPLHQEYNTEEQRITLREDLERKFSNNKRVVIVDLGNVFSDGNIASYYQDSYHYNTAGNLAIAKVLLPYVEQGINNIKSTQ